jgi:FtsH-binding integral membrane protein
MNYTQRPQAAYGTDQLVDSGLQSFMRGVYNTMGIGLVVTGLVAFATASSDQMMALIYGTPLKWVVMLAPLAFVFLGFTPARMARMNPGQARTLFYVFAAVMGLSMAAIFVVFTGESIARVFFVTAGAFAATSLYGYTTKKDLTRMGSFMFMGLIGIVIASLVNLFIGSEMVQFVVSVLGVVIFTGLTAWETQMLKETYVYGGGAANDKLAISGALGLYLSFINLFQSLLHLMGNRE